MKAKHRLMETQSSKITIANAIQRFMRLKCIAEPNWKSRALEVLAQQFGDNLPLDEISPTQLSKLVFYLDEEDRDSQHHTLTVFFQFCYEMGFINRDLRPALKIDSPLLDPQSIHLPKEINYISAEGKKRFEKELEYLYTDQRPRIARWLAHAAPGSGPGRPAFDIPKEIQSLLEGRIADLGALLRDAVVIEHARERFLFPNCINVGDTVRIQELGETGIEEYTLLGVHEADPSKGRISFTSPMGQALLGHLAGDEVSLQAPMGELKIQILETAREEIVYNEPCEFVDYVRYDR